MSLSGSAAESYNKTGDAQLRFNDPAPPEPTLENPAGVAPQVGTESAQPGTMPGAGAAEDNDPRNIFGNPNVFRDTFGQLSSSFSNTIATVEGELPSGLGTKAKNLIDRLKEMQAEIDGWRGGQPLAEKPNVERNDDVSRGSQEQTGVLGIRLEAVGGWVVGVTDYPTGDMGDTYRNIYSETDCLVHAQQQQQAPPDD